MIKYILTTVLLLFIFTLPANTENNYIVYPTNIIKFNWTEASGYPEFYNIFISENDGDFILTDTSIVNSYTLVGEYGCWYSMKVQAADYDGNLGPMSRESTTVIILPKFIVSYKQGVNHILLPVNDLRIIDLYDWCSIIGRENISHILYYDEIENKFQAFSSDYDFNHPLNRFVDVHTNYVLIMNNNVDVIYYGEVWRELD